MINIDKELLKKLSTWAIVLPVILTLWALYASTKLSAAGSDAKRQLEQTQQVEKSLGKIVELRAQLGGDFSEPTAVEFDSVVYIRNCARQAGIRETTISRGQTSKPQKQKDNSLLYYETYIIKGVHLVQLARFIDNAERSYSSFTCTQLTITPHTHSNVKDSWDATINFQYMTK